MVLKIKAKEISSKIMAKILEEITEAISNKSQKNLSRKLIRKPWTDCWTNQLKKLSLMKLLTAVNKLDLIRSMRMPFSKKWVKPQSSRLQPTIKRQFSTDQIKQLLEISWKLPAWPANTTQWWILHQSVQPVWEAAEQKEGLISDYQFEYPSSFFEFDATQTNLNHCLSIFYSYLCLDHLISILELIIQMIFN